MIEMEGKLCNQFIYILINLGSNYNYGSPKLVKKCNLAKELHAESWLVQLESKIRIKFNHWVKSCTFQFNDTPTTTHLNLLSLGVYNIFLGMDWLYLHRTKVDFYENEIECIDELVKIKILQRNRKAISMRLI